MMFESGSEWPQKLQPALLAANTSRKRSTGYTPFYLMYGRNANALHLFKYHGLNFEVFISENDSDKLDTTNLSPHDSPEFFEPLQEERIISREQAQETILSEQICQKGIFDKKVNKNR